MLKKRHGKRASRNSLGLLFITGLLLSFSSSESMGQRAKKSVVRSGEAGQLLKQGTYYQSIDDISDRAADSYRLVILKYPDSFEAEQALFYLASYYQKKFFILEETSGVQDWSAFNEAEDALYKYIKKYTLKGRGSYLGDAYHTLAIIALKRGNIELAKQDLSKMSKTGARDPKVFIYKVVWSHDASAVNADCNTRALASGTLESVSSPLNFNQFISNLRTWCRSHCGK